MAVIKPNIPYWGTVDAILRSRLILEAETLRANVVELLTGIKKTHTLPNINVSLVPQAYACEIVPSGDVLIDQREIEVCDIKWVFEACKADFDYNYTNGIAPAFTQLDGIYNMGPNQFMVDRILDLMMQQNSLFLDFLIWTGNTALINPVPFNFDLQLCRGLLWHIINEGGFIPVPLKSSVLTNPTTIITELNKMYSALPAAMYQLIRRPRSGKELILYTSTGTLRALEQFLSTQSTETTIADIEQREGVMYFRGIRIFATDAIPANYAIITYSSNLFVGTDLMSDFDEIRFLDRSEHDLRSDKIQISAKYRIGTAVNFMNELVYYFPA